MKEAGRDGKKEGSSERASHGRGEGGREAGNDGEVIVRGSVGEKEGF